MSTPTDADLRAAAEIIALRARTILDRTRKLEFTVPAPGGLPDEGLTNIALFLAGVAALVASGAPCHAVVAGVAHLYAHSETLLRDDATETLLRSMKIDPHQRVM